MMLSRKGFNSLSQRRRQVRTPEPIMSAVSAAGHQAFEAASARSLDVLFDHPPANSGDALHVYLDGVHECSLPLVQGCRCTEVRVAPGQWDSAQTVHTVDVYLSGIEGRVLDHQSALVCAGPCATPAAHACGLEQGQVRRMTADVQRVDYRVSRDGLPFGPWHGDYQEPAADGSQDGHYVVQVRFVDQDARVLQLQTISFRVVAGMVEAVECTVRDRQPE